MKESVLFSSFAHTAASLPDLRGCPLWLLLSHLYHYLAGLQSVFWWKLNRISTLSGLKETTLRKRKLQTFGSTNVIADIHRGPWILKKE